MIFNRKHNLFEGQLLQVSETQEALNRSPGRSERTARAVRAGATAGSSDGATAGRDAVSSDTESLAGGTRPLNQRKGGDQL